MYKALDLGSLGIRATALEAIKMAARWNYLGVMLSPEQILEAGPERVCDALAEFGILNAGFGIGSDYHKSGDDYEAGLTAFRKKAALERKTGATRALTWIMPGDPDRDFDAQFDFLVRRLRPYARALEEEGISLALEFVGTGAAYLQSPHPFIHTPKAMLRLCDALCVKRCGLLMDAHHLYTAGFDPDHILEFRAEDVQFVHVNDAMTGYTRETLPDSPRLLPGESGVVNAPAFLQNLQRIGYEGPVVVEPFYPPFQALTDPEAILRMNTEALDRVWSKGKRP